MSIEKVDDGRNVLKRLGSLIGSVVLLAVVAGCGSGGDGDRAAEPVQLVVSAAASMTEAIEACAPEFEETGGAKIRLSFGGSDELAAQIRQGADVDAYAAANTDIPADLHTEGLLGDPVAFATNALVVAVPADSEIDSIDDVTADGLTLAVGSDSVPVGAYTRETLADLPTADEAAILANVRSNEPDVKGIVGKLNQGAVDAGFVYATDVSATDGELRAVDIPPELEPEVAYAAGVVTGSEHPEQAAAFVESLVGGECAGALGAAGFGEAP